MALRLSLACVLLLASAVLSAQAPAASGHPESYPAADITYGASVYAAQCERCHGTAGDGVANANLSTGKFRNAQTDVQLRAVIGDGFPATGMPSFAGKLDPGQLTGLVAYLRNMNTFDRGSMKPGEAARGQALFESARAACVKCHQVNNRGGRMGPDLSDIGAKRTAGSLERSIVDPTSQMFPINRPVHLVTKTGAVFDGRRLNEDTYTVQIADYNGRLISISKSDLREFAISTKSNMPPYKDELNDQDIADLIAYLLSLKGQ